MSAFGSGLYKLNPILQVILDLRCSFVAIVHSPFVLAQVLFTNSIVKQEPEEHSRRGRIIFNLEIQKDLIVEVCVAKMVKNRYEFDEIPDSLQCSTQATAT